MSKMTKVTIVSPKEVIIKEKVVNKKTQETMYVEATIEDVIANIDNIDNYSFNISGVTVDEVNLGVVELPEEITSLYDSTLFNLVATVVVGKFGEYVRANYRRKKGAVTVETRDAFHTALNRLLNPEK